MKDLDLPAHRALFKFFDDILAGLNRQIGDQFPLDLLSVLRRPTLLRVNHRQGQGRIALLLSDGRQNVNPATFEFENSLRQVAVVVSDLDAMKTFGLNLIHFIGYRVIAQGCETTTYSSLCRLRHPKEFHRIRSFATLF
jgi:hypothetical protein